MCERKKRVDQKSIDDITAREQAATPGPWEWRKTRTDETIGIVGPKDVVLCAAKNEFHMGRADAEFIAHARTDISVLIAEVKRLREHD